MGIEWQQFEIHVDSKEKFEKLRKEFIPFVAEQKNLFYFNSYSGMHEGKEYFFMKLGLPKSISDELKDKILDKAVIDYGAVIKSSAPDLRLQDGMVVDDIKELATQTTMNVFKQKKLTEPQTYLFFHILMNQLGYNYEEELNIYLSLAYNVRFGRAH